MSEDQKGDNAWWRLLPAILTLAGILVGVWKFNSEQRHRDQDAFRRNIWEKQLEAYEKVGNATAKIVTSTADSISFEQAVDEYKKLYWGVMPLVQDDQVEKTMIKFNSEIRYFRRKESTVDDLRKRGYQLMIACKKSLNDSWGDLIKDE